MACPKNTKNERIIGYSYSRVYNYLQFDNNFIVFEYLTESGFLMDFYVNTRIMCSIELPSGAISNSSDLLMYIKGKTLNISVIGAQSHKYSIQFDDACRYYEIAGYCIMVIKKPFLIAIVYNVPTIAFSIYTIPRLIDEINDYSSYVSSYDPSTEPSIDVDSIVTQYFNITAMSGVQYDNVYIGDNSNAFGYNLIRAFLGAVTADALSNYAFTIDRTPLTVVYTGLSLSTSWQQDPLYTYFTLLRPKLDNQGNFYSYPQYDPLDENSSIQNLHMILALSNSNSIDFFQLFLNTCSIFGNGQLPS